MIPGCSGGGTALDLSPTKSLLEGHLVIEGVSHEARKGEERSRKHWKGLLEILANPQDGL